jgi:hypothetical protein
MSAQLESDETTLASAGVSLAELASATADYVRHQSLYRIKVVANALTEQERQFLQRAGASGVGDDFDPTAYTETLKTSALDYAKMIAMSWTQAKVAGFLGVSSSRIRQRTDAKTLYALNTPKGRVYPSWQFADKGTVPGLEDVLPLINDDAHPIGVQSFLLTPQCDLEDEVNGQLVQFNPLNWLLTGHSVEAVKKLAAHI